MSRMIYMGIGIAILLSCQPKEPKEWGLKESITLEGISPIGLAVDDRNHIWLADGDNNRIIELDNDFNVINTIDGFERPMHLAWEESVLYIPEYGTDGISMLSDVTQREYLNIPDSLDAPAGIDVFQDKIAIADFYNHRIVYFDGEAWSSFGIEGNGNGEFYYPTDVQITEEKVYVADAYNNRVQVFDHQGKWLNTIGESEDINAATGIYVSDDQLFVTDFEHDRVLVYTLSGEMTQEIVELSKPTDAILVNESLVITNYKGKRLDILTLE